MTTISPSFLACDLLNIEKEIGYFNEIDDLWFHLDIMDGHFVPNLTFGHPIVKKMSRISKKPLDAHLMVNNPEFYIETFKNFNIYNITIHFEACDNLSHILTIAKKLYPSVGISIRPKTPISQLSDDLLKEINLVLVMSVEPGFAGQDFMESSYEKLKELSMRKKSLNADFIIQVDGGVSDKNAQKLVESGAENLVAGSYIFNASNENYLKKIEGIRFPK